MALLDDRQTALINQINTLAIDSPEVWELATALAVTRVANASVGSGGGGVGSAALSYDEILNLTNSVQTIKGAAGDLYGLTAYNTNSVTVFLKFYDAASVTVGTTVPVLRLPVPANEGIVIIDPLANLKTFANSIKVAVTTGIANNDAIAPTNNIFLASWYV